MNPLAILAGLAASVAQRVLSGRLEGALGGLIDAVANRQKSAEEAKAEIGVALAGAAREIGTATEAELTARHGHLLEAAGASPLVGRVWAAAVLAQLFVLVWYQFVVPFGQWAGWWDRFPSPGATLEWAYLLVGALLLGAPVAARGNALTTIFGRFLPQR